MKPSPATPTLAGWPALLGALLLGCTTQTSPDTSNKPDSGAPVSDAASDEGPIDAPVDVFIGCDPASVAAFQPPAYVPAVAHQDVCSSSDVARGRLFPIEREIAAAEPHEEEDDARRRRGRRPDG